jgi:sialic acid synthase SpsE
MIAIKNRFNVKVWYSDHTTGMEVPIAAASLGASVIEKHFYMDVIWKALIIKRA